MTNVGIGKYNFRLAHLRFIIFEGLQSVVKVAILDILKIWLAWFIKSNVVLMVLLSRLLLLLLRYYVI